MNFATDLIPDEQPQQMSELNNQSVDAPKEENRMEVNCNGHASTPESGPTPEGKRSDLPTEQDDQQNANPSESNTENNDLLNNNAKHQRCNGSPGDPDPPQLPAASVSPVSVTVELKEGEKEEKMDVRGDVKKEDKDKDGQNGLLKTLLLFYSVCIVKCLKLLSLS